MYITANKLNYKVTCQSIINLSKSLFCIIICYTLGGILGVQIVSFMPYKVTTNPLAVHLLVFNKKIVPTLFRNVQ